MPTHYTDALGAANDVTIANGSLYWSGVAGGRIDLWEKTGGRLILKSKKDLKGMYMKLIVNGHKVPYYAISHNNVFWYYPGHIIVNIGGIKYQIGDSSVGGGNKGEFTSSEYGDQLIEIKPSIIDPDYFEMWVNGQFYQGMTSPDPVKISITGYGAVEVKEAKYKVPFESCSQRGNRILITESFAGPQTFNEFKLSYSPAQYCLDHPVIITDAIKKGSAATSEPYAILSKGETFTIPSTQTYTFYYLAYNDGSIPMACEESAYSPERNRCEDITAIVHLCPEGVFDPAIGSCAVTPEIKYICEFGRYDVALGMCVWNPPIHAICLEGDYNSVTMMCEVFPDTDYICAIGEFNTDTDMCEYTPDTAPICDTDLGYVYNYATNKCEYEPPNAVICPYNTVYNPDTNICEQHPEQIISCPGGYTYNITSDNCEKHVVSTIFCDGDYDPDTGLCVKEVVVSCPAGRLDFDSDLGEYICISEPDTEIFCPEGIYNELKDKCIIIPDYEIVNDSQQQVIDGIDDEDKEEIIEGMDNTLLLFIIGGVFLLLLIIMKR